MKVYELSLAGNEPYQNVESFVRGIDWTSVNFMEVDRPITHSRYRNTVNGIDIYFCYGTDSYLFTEE